jgi:glucose/arabinose dehydrogenase
MLSCAIVALAAVTACALNAFAAGGHSPPTISKVAPVKVARGAQITISGHGFVPGKGRNAVVFRGAKGNADDVTAWSTKAPTEAKVVLDAPAASVVAGGRGAVSGPVQVVNKHGKSRPSAAVVQFDDDGDGLSNEREISLGTNPRQRDSDGDGVADGKDPDPLHAPVLPPPGQAPAAGTVLDGPPDTAIDSAPHGITPDATPTFQFHSTESDSSFECSLDQGTPSFAACSGPGASHTPGSELAEGTYTFRVRAIDATSHVDPTPATETFTVNTPPDTVIDSIPQGTTPDTTPTFQFHSTKAGSSFECSIDQGIPAFDPCSGPGASHTPASALPEGAYTFRVRAVASGSNVDPTPATEAFAIGPTSGCTVMGPAIAGTGLISTFEGLENVTAEARSKIGHDAYTGGGFVAICLLRKQLGDPDSTYQVVRPTSSPLAGALTDGQRPEKGTSYVYRTDVVTDEGHIPGANVLTARGAASVADSDGWAQLEENCTKCGSTSLQAGSLRSTVKSTGSSPGQYVGQIAVYKDRVALGWHPSALPDHPEQAGTLASTRVLVPLSPSTPGTHVSAQLNLSVEHPAVMRNAAAGTTADLRDSTSPWISVEARRYADGTIKVVARDSASGGPDNVIAETGDLTAPNLQNIFLTVQLTAPDRYTVRYKPNTQEPDEDVTLDLDPGPGVDRPLPGPMPEAWLSLGNEMSKAEVATHDVRFDDVDSVYQTDYRELPNDSFGGAGTNVQLPAGFSANEVTADLLAPTAIDFAANGDMYVALRDGKVMRLPASVADGPGSGAGIEEVLDITDLVNSGENDHGLTGFVLDPDFASNGFFYVFYTVQKADTAGDRTVSRVERFHVGVGGTADRNDPLRKVLVGADAPAPDTGDLATSDTCPPGPTSDCLPSDFYTHSSGGLEFGSDKMLWISTPDGSIPEGKEANGTDHRGLRAINPDSLAGKVLRVDPATGAGVPGNPNYATETNKKSPRARTWAMGFRNPFRLAQRPGVGSWYATDVGWGAWEEVDVLPATAVAGSVPNYGWPCYEGNPESVYKTLYPAQCSFPSPKPPLYAYSSDAVDHAVIGAAFYTGSAYPAPWKPGAGEAAFYYGDYPSGDITRVTTNASDQISSPGDVQAFASGFGNVVMVTQGPVDRTNPGGDQALYVVDLGAIDQAIGRVWRITYDGP